MSRAFNNVARAEGRFKPGRPESLKLPIYSVKLRAVSEVGSPVQGASISLGPISSETDEEGVATFMGVPNGAYHVSVEWLGLNVYEGEVVVEGNVERDLPLQVYDIDLRAVTADGKPVRVDYYLRDPAGREFEGRHVDRISIRHVPNGICHLEVYLEEGPIWTRDYEVRELAKEGELKLPIAELRISVKWEDGRGVGPAKVRLVDPRGERLEAVTDREGAASLGLRGFGTYKLLVYYPNSELIIVNKDISWWGGEVSIELERALVTVKVVDALGRPVEGAQVTISYMGVPLGYGETGRDGMVVSEVLKLPIYEVRAFYKGREARSEVAPNSLVELRLEGGGWGGIELLTSPSVIAVLVMVIIAVIAIPKILKKASEKVWEEEV